MSEQTHAQENVDAVKPKRRAGRIAVGVLLALSLVLSAGSAGYLIWEYVAETAPVELRGDSHLTSDKFTVYIGLNDKDTHEQLVSKKEARNKVDTICTRHDVGFTVLSAEGGWKGDSDSVERENTLVYVFYGVDEGLVNQIADEARVELNQTSVLVEKAQTSYTYRE